MKSTITALFLLALLTGCGERTVYLIKDDNKKPVSIVLNNHQADSLYCNYVLPKKYKLLSNPSKTIYLIGTINKYGRWSYMYVEQQYDGSNFWMGQRTEFEDSCEAKKAFLEIMEKDISSFKPINSK